MGLPQKKFHDNKDARAINLDNKLRTIKIGKMTVNEYCTKIQAMANRLKNLDCEVSEKNMVIFAVNGLDSRLATLAKIIRRREPLPTFKTVRNMFLLKESSFNDDSTSTTFESSSSSLTILMASSSSDTKGDLYPVTKPSTLPVTFVSTSPTTWHQRLGHPGDEVLHSLNSRHLIFYNKEKSTHVCHACQLDQNWCNAMYDEYNALVKNGTWLIVPRPTDANLVHFMWLFKHKSNVDGTLSRYKARLVANGSSQQLNVDFDETFSPVVKPTTIHTIFSLAVSRKWPIHQLDVKNAFLNDDLSETVYMHQPPGFVNSHYPHHAL
ncbi:hybrid signal transduction histidine kinase M [Tanacetum coccineum]